jgi:hypothetical protein
LDGCDAGWGFHRIREPLSDPFTPSKSLRSGMKSCDWPHPSNRALRKRHPCRPE